MDFCEILYRPVIRGQIQPILDGFGQPQKINYYMCVDMIAQ